MHVRFTLKNFLYWLTYSVDVKVYPSLRILTFKLCMGFMAVLIALSAVVVGIGIAFVVRGRIIEISRIYDTYFPTARLTDGLLILDDDTPVIYRGSDYKVVMDVTGERHDRDSEFPIALFFMRDRMIIDTSQSGVKEYKYAEFQSWFQNDIKITSEIIYSNWALAALAAFFFWSALLFLNWSIHTALLTMIGALVVGVVATFFRILLPRSEQLKIAITAAVPAIVLTAIEHLLLIDEGVGFGIAPLPGSLFLFNILVFGVFLILGARGYLLPFLPKDSE